ncbi:MAG TPA: zf-HC2 domain-containing protein [Thermoanaerobaculia bacterium]
MAESPPAFRDTLLELIDSTPAPMDHPSPDRWLAYHRGELPAVEAAQLEQHLVRCRDCFDLAAGAASFAEADAAPTAADEMETAALWRLLRPQLEPLPAQPDNVRAIADFPSLKRTFWPRLPTSLAALFFVALVGSSAWNLSQLNTIRALQQPVLNAVIVEVPPIEKDAAPSEVTMTAGPQTLVLHPARRLPSYRLVIRDAASGKESSSYDGLQLDRDFALTLGLPAGLRPGRYRMELLDSSGNLLESRPLLVTANVERRAAGLISSVLPCALQFVPVSCCASSAA